MSSGTCTLKGFCLFSSKKSQSYGAGETESYSPSLPRRREPLHRGSGAAQRHRRRVDGLREEEREPWGVNQALRFHPGSSTDTTHVRFCGVWWGQEEDQPVSHGT